jgi:hypothetical protein
MNKKNLLIASEIVLIVLLLVTYQILDYRIKNFSRDCREEFDVNAPCPCQQTKYNQTLINENQFLPDYNFSGLDLK